MKERPILFSAPMVRAILDGSKTQTRRIVKPAPPAEFNLLRHQSEAGFVYAADYSKMSRTIGEGPRIRWDCPQGQPGDRLWVRETSMDLQGTGVEHRDDSGKMKRFAYAADCPPGSYGDAARKDYGLKWKPSIFMPKAACRINLEITGVRVERLQSISEADAIAEGISVWSKSERHGTKWDCPAHVRRYGEGDDIEDAGFEGGPVKDPREAYRGVWSAINGPGSWEANPWVWIIEFRRVA